MSPALKRTIVAALAGCALAAGPGTAHAAAAPNTGAPGSPCRAVVSRGASPSGLDTTSLGPRAPAPYEIGAPTRLPESLEPARRVMLIVHGGGWYRVGRGTLAAERSNATAWRAAGWQTVSIDYRACAKSVYDVLTFYDLVRDRVGPDVPICVQGESAGGQLALLLAAKRRDVACAIAYAAPTDFWTISAQGAAAAAEGSGSPKLGSGGRHALGMARAAFGRRRLAARSPVTHVASLPARVLLATAADDELIPVEQGRQLASQRRAATGGGEVDVVALEPGATRFVHGTASDAALTRLLSHVTDLVRPYGAGPAAGFAPPFIPWRPRPR